MRVAVERKNLEAEGIVSLELTHPGGAALPAFSAGSHIDVHTPAGLVRQYSLCNSPAERQRYLISILREPNSRGGSASLHDQVQQGDLLEISEPRNNFPIRAANRFLLFGGGIGITPILCIAERLHERGGVEFELHYSGRTRRRMAFVERIKASPFADRAHFHFDEEPGGEDMNLPAVLASPAPDLRLFVCGPTGYMDWVIETARGAGWSEDHIHREYFTAGEIDTSGDRAFEVQIASSGQILVVAADRSVSDVLAEAGIDVPLSCGEGVCGTCLVRVIGGEIDHRDLFLMDAEKKSNEVFTPCVSRAIGSRLVLDL